MSANPEMSAISGSPLPAALVEKMTQARALYAEMLDIIAELDHEQIAVFAGYPSLPAFLTHLLRIAPVKARRMVAHATQVTEAATPTGYVAPAKLPVVRAALQEGAIDADQVQAIADTIAELPTWATPDHRDLVETTLTDTARVHDVRTVKEQGRALLERIDQDGDNPHLEPELAEPTNILRYTRLRDGGLKFTGRIDKEATAELLTMLGPLAKPVSPAPNVPDPRSGQERQGDGLAAIIHLAAQSKETPERAHVAVTMPLNVLIEGLGTATLDDGSVLAASAARRLACDAGIVPVVLNGDSVPLDVGREHRLVDHRQRAALVARDHGCAFPGCHLPARWADAHHVIHWADGGVTDINNLVLLCRRHHNLIHHSEWSVQMINGIPWFKPPAWLDPEQNLVRNILHHPRC